VNIFDGDIYMEEETRQLLRQKEEEMKGLFGVERGRFELKIKTLLLENRTDVRDAGLCRAMPFLWRDPHTPYYSPLLLLAQPSGRKLKSLVTGTMSWL
ncbi:hypothetical protein FOZ63_023408, partial [Perkinsus olseni]